MKQRTAFRLAWSACALTLVLIVGFYVLCVLNQAGLEDLTFPIVGVSSAVVGGVVASRRPGNLIGWLFLGSALVAAFRSLAGEYAVYGISTNPGALPLAPLAAWLSVSVRMVGPILGFVLLPLFFPNGKVVSRRWKVILLLTLAVLPVGVFMDAFSPGEAVYGSGIQNPYAVEALGPVSGFYSPVSFVLYMGLIFASAASLVARFRLASGEERQQIKWFTFAAAAIPVWFMVNAPIQHTFPNLFAVMDSLIIATVPMAAGVAILRYRLYDIDIIINRALVYALLTVSLVLTYLGGVVVLQWSFRAATGQESSLAVVASTLAIAALFNPVRRRIQDFIDRLFYRKKYDAERTLREFSARLREEMDLDELSGDLMSVVRETVQPEHVSLWLAPVDGGRKEKERGNFEISGQGESRNDFRNVRETVSS